MRKSFIERFNEEYNKSDFWTLNKKICVILSALALVVLVFTGCTKDEAEIRQETPVEELPQDTIKVGDDGVNASIAPDDSPSKAMVSMSVEDIGRADPFLPFGASSQVSSSQTAYENYDLIPPPETITVDTEAKEVMSTKVSGIMYDKYSPSAIINISDSDYLVRAGDVINGYKVLSIGKDTVTVQHGANIYKAGVGELFVEGELNFNTISNLESKFGGRRNTVNKQ